MASMTMQRFVPPFTAMGPRKRTISCSSDGVLYQSPRKQVKKAYHQLKPQQFKKKKLTSEEIRQIDSIFAADSKTDLKFPFCQPSTSQRGSEAARMAQKEVDKKIAEREELAAGISDVWKGAVALKQPGFKNLTGSLCYRNSLLQSLLHIPKFINWLQKCHERGECCADDLTSCMPCALRDLAGVYWLRDSKDRNLTVILREINSILKFRGWTTDSLNGHGDPDDQFTAMVEYMTEDIGAEGLAQFHAIHNTLFTSCIRCSSCGHTTDPHHSEERTISLPLEAKLNNQNLGSFLSAFLQDKISGYKCEGCHQIVDVVREVKMSSPADVLTLQLKRASWSGKVIKTKVQITQFLDLTEHAVDGSVPLKYELIATVAHIGNSDFGHYIAYGVGPDGRWNQFDDMATTRANVEEAMNPGGGVKPVLLYYKRVREE